MRLKPFYFFVFLLLFTVIAETKRSGSISRSRKTGSSSGSTWTRRSKPKQQEVKKPVEAAKPVAQPAAPPKPAPSAPKAPEPEIKRDNANLQQSGKPIGWNVDGAGGKPAGGGLDQKQHVSPSQSGVPQSGAYPQSGGYGQSGAYPQSGPHPQGGYGHNGAQPQGGYPPNGAIPQTGAYPQNGAYGQNGAYPQSGAYPQNGAYPQGAGYGHNGGYPQQGPVGYPQQPGGGYGGYGGNHQQNNGFFGGGGGGGFGGGGYGGYGGGGYGGYGMKKSGGFFGKHTFRNVLAGLFVWHLVSGLTSKPYKVYNYYNQPAESEHKEISLPPNTLTLCNENATTLCVPGTTSLCTLDNRILCVTSISSTTPCQDNNKALCVNSTIPCLEGDPLCQNKTAGDNTTSVNLPCFTNLTLEKGSLPPGSNVVLPQSSNNQFCVTTMAEPDTSVAANATNNGTVPAVVPSIEQPKNITMEPIPELKDVNGTKVAESIKDLDSLKVVPLPEPIPIVEGVSVEPPKDLAPEGVNKTEAIV